jgi:hypothetical protein
VPHPNIWPTYSLNSLEVWACVSGRTALSPSFFAMKLDEMEGSWLENGTGPLIQAFCSTHLFPSSIVL